MSYFPNAIQPHLENCHLFDIGGQLNFNVYRTDGMPNDSLIAQYGIATLANDIAIAATHNSQARFPPPKCYPETRHAILAQIIKWVEEQAESPHGKRILWIFGPAGAGKSAIAQTIAELFAQRQALAASFFFTCGNDRRGLVNHVITTIAYQLANSVPEMRDVIGTAISCDPSILSLSLDIQIQRLIVEPLVSVFSRPSTHRHQRYLVIIDGLDECDGDNNQSRLISLIGDLFHDHNLPFTFIFASRPEPHIRNSFRNDPRVSILTQEFELDPSPEDIRMFLLTSFHAIRNDNPGLMSLDEHWPSQEAIDTLVYRSSGYFIYASTVVKFIGDKDMRPTESLELVLACKSSPFSSLDDIYRQILLTVPQVRRPVLASILEIIVADLWVSDQGPRNNQCPRSWELEELLGLPDGEVPVILRRMHSLLRNIDSTDDAIEFAHASFWDFLRDKERSGMFYVNPELGHAKIAEAFVRRARLGLLPNRFRHTWPQHANYGHTQVKLSMFLEDLRAVKIDTWVECLNMNPYPLEGWHFDSQSEILEMWIDNLESLFCLPEDRLQPHLSPSNQPSVIMEIFTKLLERTYKQDLGSGQLRLTAFFLKETNPAEPIDVSIKTHTILITHQHYHMHQGVDSKRKFLLGEFLLDQSHGGDFPIISMAVHEHAFHLCVKRLVKGFARVCVGNTVNKPS